MRMRLSLASSVRSMRNRRCCGADSDWPVDDSASVRDFSDRRRAIAAVIASKKIQPTYGLHQVAVDPEFLSVGEVHFEIVGGKHQKGQPVIAGGF